MKRLAFALFSMLAVFAAFSQGECLLKISVHSPQPWPYLSEGAPVLLNFSVKNLSAGGAATTNLDAPHPYARLGNGTDLALSQSGGFYFANFSPYAPADKAVGNISINASNSGCGFAAKETIYYYPGQKKSTTIPEFDFTIAKSF